ncbi:MAG: B12-binding domain-containing radical SAM protein [Stygiobacter sp. RIFOXYC12_FULL_38_8]|nr:MAG: B12-binding domain-containing radical SAM protein [Stygiobacter sp. GWC2_38_9]OGU82855.1 MAG: B12-binding domain-containing radical SAM protein [Stygiobacter sp. RIFOXYA12_FULL_38_9]OGV09344.1 MAG: B12-binding domain-containing radical SAM protein [Stygiobacter sp. RIFOXYB2_FULL_37_11]OGV11778.1 MAG: B12-binding domain-containing radical SAM protein [Stygiobacter sp. RIFOXYA2_FULL_38_8]OGV16592.1 MAG: B12-binding domain-containing radical SAM protein [Stygiobacter sp. RIFOXYC2_FULL_38_2
MNILMVYPMYPDTFWSFKHALKFVSKKASFPPLGLLTVASMLPEEWNKKLIDMNASQLKDGDILWADYVFISAMSIQSESAKQVIERCKTLNTKIVAGGPLFTSSSDDYQQVDHLVLNEAEKTLPLFLDDLAEGNPQHKYTSEDWADITTTPLPLWNLVPMNNYSSMNIQYSRGCPFDCDFCDITVLYGRKPRTKTKEQVLAELDLLFLSGWRGPVFFVDDNFIGNKSKLKNEILPAIIEWNEKRNNPFYFNTEVSINLADDENLMQLMVIAGFEAVFVGIETPNEESLAECNKTQNRNRDLIASIKKIQDFGLEVQGGFIVGFDNDPPSIFEKLSSFIQESGIVTAMVGLLNAPKGTKLQKRLLSEGRMLKDFTGNNTDFSVNFIPNMDRAELLKGYQKILNTIYSPKYYYERVTSFLRDYKPKKKKVFHLNSNYVLALFRSMFKLGIVGEERFYYWKLFFWTLLRKPQLFSLAILFTIYGYHFRKISNGFC